MKVTISSGHGKHVAGAIGYIDEVTEARKVTDQVAEYLQQLGCLSEKYHENNARNKTDNLNTIIRHHNGTTRDLDLSVHFNAFKKMDKDMGVEVCYRNKAEKTLADRLCAEISKVSGLSNRMAKQRTNLGFLNYTNKPAVLLEVCFVDSKEDVRKYKENFESICKAIAEALTGKKITVVSPNEERCKVQVIFADNSKRYLEFLSLLNDLNISPMSEQGRSTTKVIATFAPKSTKYVKVIQWLNTNKISFK